MDVRAACHSPCWHVGLLSWGAAPSKYWLKNLSWNFVILNMRRKALFLIFPPSTAVQGWVDSVKSVTSHDFLTQSSQVTSHAAPVDSVKSLCRVVTVTE